MGSVLPNWIGKPHMTMLVWMVMVMVIGVDGSWERHN
jgi:hypothetical protein